MLLLVLARSSYKYHISVSMHFVEVLREPKRLIAIVRSILVLSFLH